MLSESAKMSSAAEARFRINAPNSKLRNVKVIALDGPSEALVKRLAQLRWNGASFCTASAFAPRPYPPQAGEGREGAGPGGLSMQGWLSDLAGRTKDLVDEVD